MNTCKACGVEFEGRKDAKFCSPKCRVTFSRKSSLVTDNVTDNGVDVTDNLIFKFKTPNNCSLSGWHEVGGAVQIRKAKYWYDVPIAAVPVKSMGPKMPDYMNGRQYFLWWKNEFKMNGDKPEIHNPFKPKRV